MIWFTADTHFGHANIIKYCRRPFNSVREMDTQLINNWNEVISEADVVYHLGDFTMGNASIARNYFKQLNGNIYVVPGGHDKKWAVSAGAFRSASNYLVHILPPLHTITVGVSGRKATIVLCHYAMRVWNKSHYNSWQLYGHCFDMQTELLTNSGWKPRGEIEVTDKIMTLNVDTSFLEYNCINDIFDYPNYTGEVYTADTPSVNFRVTSGHTMLDLSRPGLEVRRFPAFQFRDIGRRILVHAGTYKHQSKIINISDDHLRLLVWIATDGSLRNGSLVRVVVKKHRKIKRIGELLDTLNISHRRLPQEDGSISFNFTVPDELSKFDSLRPLDEKIRFLNRAQVKVLLAEYAVTDGQKLHNTYLIYTAKKAEADIIQEVCVKNGFRCGVTSRIHGWGANTQYTLSILDRPNKSLTSIKNRVHTEFVTKEHFWCANVPNGSLVSRRNGKVLITGNSHGRLPGIGKQYDVGVDNNRFYPTSIRKLIAIMELAGDNPNFVGRKHNERK